MSEKRKGVLFTITASLMFGVSPVFIKLLLNFTNIETANVLYTGFAGLFFLSYFAISKKTWHLLIIRSNWRKIASLGLLDAIGSLLFAYGILISGPTSASFVIQFAFVFSILFGVVFLGERFSKKEILGASFALSGLILLAYGSAEVELLSTLAVLVAAVLFATVNLFSKYYVADIPPFSLAGGRTFFIFLYLSTYALAIGKFEPFIPLVGIGYAVVGALAGMVLNFVFFFKALQVWEISKTSALRTVEPFLTALFSFAILSLAPTYNQIAGGILIVVGVAILSLIKGKTQSPRNMQDLAIRRTGTLK